MTSTSETTSRRRPCTHHLVLWLCLVATALGCAEQRDPIDRVQPYALKKSDFQDQWYYQRTVVDVPAANGFTFVGNTDHSGLQKIKFDIQEKFLFVRRNVELIKNGDDKAAKGEDYEGEVVAAFPIIKHFDVRRSYNPTTGEEVNVLEENAIDRAWHEREYMRVDWSKNNVTNYQLDFEAASIEAVPYYPQETSKGEPNPDAPLFEFDKANPYFDITSKIFAKAGTVEYASYGQIPVCWLIGEETSECGAGEYAIRHSFAKIDPNHQYVPRPYKGGETDMFGYFTSDRMVYDAKLGIKQQNKERYLNRHNIWQNWTNPDGTLIPEAQRLPRPITYHVNRDFPDDLLPVARKVAAQWNKVFKDAVQATGNPFTGDMFVLCENNPVREGDPASCGGAGTSPRLGDIRYS
ncbi:MAG TPA: hypothetical protein DCQ06_12420, partial [Myxococcales bacterium]|nr:hypothetical protein [Myxococcales bacterium]